MRESAARLLDLLWARYAAEVPPARAFVSLAGGAFRNDHVAFRVLARPGGGIDLVAGVFERLGWRRAGAYEFPDVHLRATHLSHPDELPRVFVSELDPSPFSAPVRLALGAVSPEPSPPTEIDALAGWFRPPRAGPREDDLLAVDRETPYGAWLLAFGRKVNHFTAAVDDIEGWVARLRAAGVPMKAEIEGAQGGPLRQTATAAASLPVALADGRAREWPYAYFEIAERRPDFDGFLAPQARRLFDMTRRG